jgi:hypothetical protein
MENQVKVESNTTSLKERLREEFMKCAGDPVYFMKKYYMIQHPQRGRILFNLYPFQEKVLRLYQLPDSVIINKSRQLGISTLVSAYALWLMLFNKDKNVLVIATKQETAKNMVTKVRFAYQNLPTWLKVGAQEDNRLSLRLSNGSQIKAVSAAADSARSEAVSLLVLDEAAFIDGAEEIFTSAQQTLATGGKCIALSTPNGMGNWFEKTYKKAQAKKNGFIPVSLPWSVHPERTQEWRDQQDKELGLRNAAQECDCDFSTSGATVILPEVLKDYADTIVCEPIERRGVDKSLWIWEYPEQLKYYMLVADVARGDGMDYSAFHVIDTETLTQVAEYQSQIDTRDYASVILGVASEYNNALVVVENSNIGWDVVQTIVDRGYTNMYYSHKVDNASFEEYVNKYNRGDGLVPGFTMSQKTRPLAVERLRDLIETKSVTFKSERLLDELRSFIWKNGKAQAMQGRNDDLVMSFAIAMYLRESSLRYKATADNLTYAALGSMTRTGASKPVYNTEKTLTTTPWTMEVTTGTEQKIVDLTWLI